MNQELTDRQSKILDYIRYVTRVRNYPPSVREIGEAVGLSSSSSGAWKDRRTTARMERALR